MFDIKSNGILTALSKKELVNGLQELSRKKDYSKILPSGIMIDISGNMNLMINCICNKSHRWNYASKIPGVSFKCKCGRYLIRYIRNPKYEFINKR